MALLEIQIKVYFLYTLENLSLCNNILHYGKQNLNSIIYIFNRKWEE